MRKKEREWGVEHGIIAVAVGDTISIWLKSLITTILLILFLLTAEPKATQFAESKPELFARNLSRCRSDGGN